MTTPTQDQPVSHTPGPWKIFDPLLTVVTNSKEDYRIARTDDGDSTDFDLVDVANARLIAAAPDLLAALKLWVDYDNCDEDDYVIFGDSYNAVLDAAKAAIAKAEGGAP